jgi:hypothetical protein
MAKAPSKLEQLRQMREKTEKKPKPKIAVIAKARADAKAAKAAKAKAAKAKPAKKKTNGERGAKSFAIAEMLKRAKGCTLKEVLEVTQWPAVSMPAMAKQLGIKLRIEKKPGERTRYYGN